MAIPNTVKIKKGGIEFTSNIDRSKYLLVELQRKALRDVGRLIRYRVIQEIRKRPGLARSKRAKFAVGTWVRKRETDLQIGYGNEKYGVSGDTWYAIQQELGTRNQPAKHTLRQTTYGLLSDIIRIEAQYLSSMENEAKALGLISEDDEGNSYD